MEGIQSPAASLHGRVNLSIPVLCVGSAGAVSSMVELVAAAVGLAGVFIFLAHAIEAYRCSHSIAISGDPSPDEARRSDLEPRLVCSTCGKHGADVRPNFSWNRVTTRMMGYR